MGRRSSIKSLPPAIKKAIDGAIRDGRWTLDEILDRVRDDFGTEAAPSRSALGRYRASVEEQMAAVRESREVADVWAKRLGDAPDSDIGKVVLEILRTLAYRAGADLMGGDGEIDAKELSQLARVMQQVEDAGRLSLAREKAVRDAALAEVQRNLDQVGADEGLTEATIAKIRERIMMGVAA